ncbi:MAG: phage tail protein [Caldilineaceae bacterium]|nr:phage tail protein [Caldilineaceae bacterium]
MATAREGTPGKFFDGDPLIGFMFKVSWGAGTGVTSVGVAGPDDPQVELASAYFTELSGLQDESEVITHKSIGPNGKEVTQKLPGRDDGGEITLKRGVTRGQDFWKWRQQVTAGDIQALGGIFRSRFLTEPTMKSWSSNTRMCGRRAYQ